MRAGWSRSRGFRRAAICVGMALLTLLCMELSLRFFLFHDGSFARSWGWRFRRPELYSWVRSAEYFKLACLLREGEGQRHHHPDLGWVAGRFANEDLVHDDEATLGGRRPVLLFGDSYAACVGADGECWEGLLERSAHGQELALLNYGVGGHGLDQIALTCELVLPRFADRDPLVVVAVLIDDSLDRSLLDFRGWPKPRFHVGAAGAPERDERALPDGDREYVERHGTGIASYAWRYLVWGTPLLPDSWVRERVRAEHVRELRELNAALLAALAATLDAAGVEHFVVAFHGRYELEPRPGDWRGREPFLLGELERLDLPYVLSRVPLAADREATGRVLDDYFITAGRGVNHYTALGNEVVFQALLDGIEGRFHAR